MTDLLGLPGYKYLDSWEDEYSITIKAEPESQPRICPDCGSINGYSNGRITRHYRDIESKGKFCGVEIEVQRYKCNDCGRTYYPHMPGVVDNMYITERLFNKIVEECFRYPFTNVASMHGMDESMPRRVFNEYLEGMRDIWKPILPPVLGIDEAHLAKDMRAIFVEVNKDRTSRILELAPNKKKDTVIKVLEQLRDNSTGRKAPDVVTIDFTQGYKNAVEEVFGADTKVIIDHFHVQKLITEATSKAYNKLKASMENEWASLPEADRKYNEKLWKTARISVQIFRTNKENLTLSQKNRLSRAITLYPRFATLYECKEAFRDIFNAYTDRKTAEHSYDTWVTHIPSDHEYDSFISVVQTIERWRTEVFNFFEFGRYSNGAVEALNGVIKNINRMGRGYSYEVIRAKMLYRTYATRKPTYKRVSTGKTSSKPTFTISFSGGFDFDEMYGVKTVLDSGCGVDISELLAIVERAESFSNIEIADVLTK